jgi:hypothetical protein
MSRYFVTLGREAKDDGAGMDMTSYAAARREAIRSLGEALRDDPGLLDRGRLRLDMLDEAGGLLFCVTLSTTELAASNDPVHPRHGH